MTCKVEKKNQLNNRNAKHGHTIAIVIACTVLIEIRWHRHSMILLCDFANNDELAQDNDSRTVSTV